MNLPPVLIKESVFEQWTVAFIEFISRRENGDYMIKSFTEGPLIIYKRVEDFTEEEIKRKKADKEASSNLIYAMSKLPHKDYSRIECFKNNPMLLWKELSKLMHGSEVSFKRKEEEKKSEKEDVELKSSNAEIEELKEKTNELTRRLEEVKNLLVLERKDHKKEKECLLQRISDLEKVLKIKVKECEDKKDVELKCMRLSKQNSDFEKVLFLEKGKLEKERFEYDKERKSFEAKNAKLSEKISELQKELDEESKELEKMKKSDIQSRCIKDDFAKEKKIFRQEIQKLTKNLAGLSTDIMIEKRVNCDIRKKLELVTKERNDLSFKVKSFNKSKSFSGSPIRPSNLFYDHSVDKSSKSFSDLPTYKRIDMQWRVKGTTPKKDVPKSSIPNKNTKLKVNSFVKPDSFYSANHLIRFAQKNICCSYCGTNDFVHKDYTSFWYGTYHFPSYRAPLNKPGPKTRWVPKST